MLAGSRPERDVFAEAHGVALKALIPIHGRPMVAHPVVALLAAPEVARVTVLAQQPEAIAAALPADRRLVVGRSAMTIAATIEALIANPATRFPLLVTTADHALLDPAMIAYFCARAAGADVAIGLVERRALMRRLPHGKRTWVGFRGGAYSGANLFALGGRNVGEAVALWRSVEQDRKKGWRLLAAFGTMNLLGAALRVRTLRQTLDAIGRRLHLDIRAVEMTDPLAAVDVDKPADHALVSAILAKRPDTRRS